MYFIFSKPDDCSPLGYGPGLVLNHIHNLSLTVILFFIASTVLLLAFFWMPRWEPQPKRIQHIYTCFFHPEVQIVLIVSWITELKITAWHLFFFFLYSTPLCAFTLLLKEPTARLYSGRAALHVLLDFIKFSFKKKWQKYLELPLNDDFPLTKASLTWAYSHDMMHLDEILFAINYLLIAYSRWEKIIMRSFMKWRWVRFLIPDGNQQGSKWVNSVIHSAD